MPLLAFMGCSAIWGSTFLVIRVGNGTLPPFWGCSLRLLVATFILSAILLIAKKPWPRGAALKAALIYGFLEFGLSMPLLYYGERVVSSGLAAVFYAISPVVAMFATAVIGMEKLSMKRLSAALFALAGVAVIFWHEVSGGSPALGLAAVIGAAVAGPLGGVALQRGPKQDAIASNAVAVFVGFLCSMFLSLGFGETRVTPSTWPQIFPVLYLAVFGSVGAFVLFAWLLNQWKVSTVAFIGVVIPVLAVSLGAIFLDETLTAGTFVGGVVVLAGVSVALRSEGEVSPSSVKDLVTS